MDAWIARLRTLTKVEGFPYYLLILAALAALVLPTFADLAKNLWSTDEQGHGPIVLGVALWLLYRNWNAMLAARSPASFWAWPLLLIGVLLYLAGSLFEVYLFEVGAFLPIVAAIGLQLFGGKGLRKQWFALFFLFFLIPLPSGVVETLTMPMKMAVSYAAETVMHLFNYPISRSGVILQIGQYQLLVADACAGLHTLFTLEALGLLYLNLVSRDSLGRNITLAILIVPISFAANTIRVIVLSLITYHFGDEAGQGFLHGFAGMVLFMSALMLIITTDTILHRLFDVKKGKNKALPPEAAHA
jgi:exosortase B